MKPTTFLACAAAVVAIAGCNSRQGNAATNVVAATANIRVDPPKNGDWSTVVNATPAGGFLMGNPKAKVQLIEIGSLTCPHCREFDETGVTPLVEQYVKTGKVGYEFRNYVRDPFDLTASLIARCNGAQSFFPCELLIRANNFPGPLILTSDDEPNRVEHRRRNVVAHQREGNTQLDQATQRNDIAFMNCT